MSENQIVEELVKIRELLEPKPEPPKKEEKPVGLWEEFIDFINKYGVVGLAIGFIIGSASKDLVNALVADILMPVILFFVPGGTWREATVTIGPVVLALGHFVGALLDYFIIALIVFFLMRQIKKTSIK
ncbi:MAG: MscL family protein [Candidatus Bathyarchaeota archaeon]|nr:MscL family protein [Candidatus Bathyarchaeota archaeon]